MRLLLIPFYALSASLGLLNAAGFELSSAAGQGFSTIVDEIQRIESANSKDFGVDENVVRKEALAQVQKAALQSLDQSRDIVPAVKNTFTTSFASSPTRGKSQNSRDIRSLLREAQLNNLAPIVIDEMGKVLLDIPQSNNPDSPTFSRKISIEDFSCMDD